VSFGEEAEDAFDLIVPDLPGYGFSDKPKKHGTIFHVHDLWARLMADTLGYQTFGAHGGAQSRNNSHAATRIPLWPFI
jgi:pimeloyl-ACP methyl ester carboxylesterase